MAETERYGTSRTPFDAVSAENAVGGVGGGVGAALPRVFPAARTPIFPAGEPEEADAVADGQESAKGTELAAPGAREYDR